MMMTFGYSSGILGVNISSLIPVLGRDPSDVTGIQPAQVFGPKRLLRAADAALLDSCDEHRNEGSVEDCAWPASNFTSGV
ncbi:hypothetical protein [Rhizobium sp. CIAT894]|uniref:hypothetical protein n=1 Tax=Rhizobium sp. CIAT894 TaxID=2020312 RepID=UPI0013DE3890|nr:hypothetical protein [Rhizobium sp. CIAT894]